eukprot:16450313-Heterocapsa_arctica.AAC.1
MAAERRGKVTNYCRKWATSKLSWCITSEEVWPICSTTGAGHHKKSRTGPLTGPQGIKGKDRRSMWPQGRQGFTAPLPEGRARAVDQQEGEWQVVSGTAASSSGRPGHPEGVSEVNRFEALRQAAEAEEVATK